MRLAASFLLLTGLAGCSTAPGPAAPQNCPFTQAATIVPTEGALFGVNLQWDRISIQGFSRATGISPAVAVSFAKFPLDQQDRTYALQATDQVRATGADLLLTLEPDAGLDTVTETSANELAAFLRGINESGVPVVVRFAHEMNGSWYAWGQQPAEYVRAFRQIAAAVHASAPGSAMLWAPNYGGGYPFAGGHYEAAPGTSARALLDTDADGALTPHDDPYAPYYPGDDAVDWVGMSLYHWGSAYPWGENELPEPDKFAAQLTGEYNGLGGDDSAVPDFYDTYGELHDKPVAIPETAALVVPRGDPVQELAIKQAWWRQVFSQETRVRFPRLRMINWFEWVKPEVEVNDTVDWAITSSAKARDAFVADFPDWLIQAEDRPRSCTTTR